MQNQKMTKRQALLALLGAVPILSYGQQIPTTTTSAGAVTPADIQPGGLRLSVEVQGGAKSSLLELRFKGQITEPEALFLRVYVDNKAEVEISVAEAIQILKGDNTPRLEYTK